MKFLKTYGRQKTKLSAWVTLQDRKQAFDSTSEADVSSQASKPKQSRKNTKALGKKKAPLTSDDEDYVFPNCAPPSRSTARSKRGAGQGGRAAKRKAMLYLSDSSEEEMMPPTQYPQRTNKRKSRGKRTRLPSSKTARQTTKSFPSDNYDDENNYGDENVCPSLPQQNKSNSGSKLGFSVTNEGDSTTGAKEGSTVKKDSHVALPSAGRFVTRRRCGVSAYPGPLRTTILNSSDDFASSRGSNHIIRPSRKSLCPVFLESSADNSVHAAGLTSSAIIPLRDISLNESTEHSLGPVTRKPIFCSTPSAASLNKTSRLKRSDQISSPPFISVSCIGPMSTLGSPEQLNSPPHSAPSDENQPILDELQKQSQLQESSNNVFTQLKSTYEKTNSIGAAKSQSEDIQELSSVITIGSDPSSYVTSETGGLEWLIDTLKVQCLTQLCTVRLERLEDLIQLFSETTYSSCLGDLGSVCSSIAKEHSVATIHSTDHTEFSQPSLDLAVTNGSYSQCVESSNSGHDVVLVTDRSVSNDFKMSEDKSTLDLCSQSTNSCSDLVEMQVATQTDESSIIKDKCLSRECSVELKRLSHLNIEEQLSPEVNLTENDQVKFRQSHENRSGVFQSEHPESADTLAVLAKELTDKCLNSKSVVEMKKMSIAEIKDKLRMNRVTPHTNTLVCEKTMDEPQSESNCMVDSANETTLGRGRRRKRTSASSNDRNASDKESKKSSNRRQSKRKKLSLAPKENKRRSSTHRPGTTRKACVSGLSVSRWKNKDVFSYRQGSKTVDCSINELIPSHHRQPLMQAGFTTPVKGGNLNISSLLADLQTPNTHTWSRLKAALSIHRKVMLTPKTPGHGLSTSLGLADLSQDLFATPFRTPLPKRLRSQLLTHESQLVFEDDDLSDAEKVYAECGQKGPLPWEQSIIPERMKKCVKIGEGTFGEVFSTNGQGGTVALKVIPLEGSEKVNGEEQKTFGEILHEIIISKELSQLKDKQRNQTSGFIGLHDLHCVKGPYPPEFLKAWDKFDQKKGSENDRPDFFEEEQLFIILEFEFGGSDLENLNGTLSSIIAAKSILHQVTAALAVAEQDLHFEHRDLHWGNVLVKVTQEKTAAFCLNGTSHVLETKGVLVRIIDYSLSRLEIDELTVSCDISRDEELFMGQGDYQFDIYRLMRQENGNDWSSYNPHTNVLWLHYLCSKLLDMKYRASGGRHCKEMRSELTSFYDNVLQYSSATEVLKNSSLFQ